MQLFFKRSKEALVGMENTKYLKRLMNFQESSFIGTVKRFLVDPQKVRIRNDVSQKFMWNFIYC